jgi:hypothetical protein
MKYPRQFTNQLTCGEEKLVEKETPNGIGVGAFSKLSIPKH